MIAYVTDMSLRNISDLKVFKMLELKKEINKRLYSRQAVVMGAPPHQRQCCFPAGFSPASMRLSHHIAKDGDELMPACQKITAQLFSAKSHTSMAGEKLNKTLKLW